MKQYIIIIFALAVLTENPFAQKADTLSINSKSLKMANLKIGKRTYIVYNKKKRQLCGENYNC